MFRRPRPLLTSLAAAAFAIAASAASTATGATTSAAARTPGGAPAHYDHVFVIVEENHGFSDVIGNPAAPNLNALAARYGVATDYFGVSHPSEPNYVAFLGGDTFGVQDDNPYYVNRVAAPSLVTQLDGAHVPWKAYLQGLPHPGYQGMCYPSNCNGSPDKDPLYVSKHNGIPNFTTADNAADWGRQVPVEQLAADLATGNVPGFGYIIPDECHDQHGDPPYCLDSGNPDGGVPASADPQDQHLVAVGDQYLGQLVQAITGAPFWARGNNAIAITYDEGNDDANGGGQIATVVVTSHGPRATRDASFYNHYSLLATIEQNFGVGCLKHACDAVTHPLTPLLAVTGAAAQAFHASTPPSYATPSPTPAEPVGVVGSTPSANGWQVAATPMLGTNDNSFGAVAAVGPGDVWAVGNYLPDTAGSNQDATLSQAAHFDGKTWTHTPTVDPGTNFASLFGVAATPGRAWAVGVALGPDFAAHSLIETWDGEAWHLMPTPRLDSERDLLNAAAAVSPTDVWAVGSQQSRGGRFETLIEHFDGTRWSVVPSPNPGSAADQLYGIAAAGPDDVWAVGQASGQDSDAPLVLHFDGHCWGVVSVPTAGSEGVLLQGVAVRAGEVWAVGQTDDAAQQARPFVEHLKNGRWSAEVAGGLGGGFSNVTGVAATGDGAYLVGSYFDAASGNQLPLVARNAGSGAGWTAVAVPNPADGVGDTVLGGASASGGSVWIAGFSNTGNGRIPLVEEHQG